MGFIVLRCSGAGRPAPRWSARWPWPHHSLEPAQPEDISTPHQLRCSSGCPVLAGRAAGQRWLVRRYGPACEWWKWQTATNRLLFPQGPTQPRFVANVPSLRSESSVRCGANGFGRVCSEQTSSKQLSLIKVERDRFDRAATGTDCSHCEADSLGGWGCLYTRWG